MRTPTRTPALPLAVLLLVATALPAAADTRIVERTGGEGADTRTIWLSDSAMRTDDGDQSVIVHLDRGELLIVDHAERQVTRLPVPVDVSSLLPEGIDLEPLLEQMRLEAEVQRTDETRTINGWDARLWKVRMSSPMVTVTSDIWASPDVDAPLEPYRRLQTEVGALQPGFREAMEKMAAIEGFPVRTETTMTAMGSEQTVVQEVVEITEAECPAGTYDAPEGYEEQEFDPMRLMR